MSEGVAGLSDGLVEAILPNVEGKTKEERGGESALSIVQSHFYPELLDAVVDEIERL